MRINKDGTTMGVTLRLVVFVFQEYARIANRANLIEINKGRKGSLTAQDVMRHRLYSLPVIKAKIAKREAANEKT